MPMCRQWKNGSKKVLNSYCDKSIDLEHNIVTLYTGLFYGDNTHQTNSFPHGNPDKDRRYAYIWKLAEYIHGGVFGTLAAHC